MNYRDALIYSIEELSSIENPDLEALKILQYVTGKDNLTIFTNPEQNISKNEEISLKEIIFKRKQHKPLAYIIGEEEFLGIRFKVNHNTLIPRLDTEFIVNETEEIIKQYNHQNIKILDLCCGSGVIGLSLKKFYPETNLTLSDVSKEALEVTKANSFNLNLKSTVIHSNLFNKIKGKFHIIVSNPPYIPLNEYKELAKEIVDYEPKSALVAGENGYCFHRQIIKQSKKYLKENGWLLLECGYNQGKNLREMFELEGFKNIEIINDFAGYNRVVKAQI